MSRSDHPARKISIFLLRRPGPMRCLNFEPAVDVIACRNPSRSLNWCENPKFCLDFSQPDSCRVRASRSLRGPCVAPPATILMSRYPKIPLDTNGFAWTAIRRSRSSPVRKVQTIAFSAICRPSAWKGSHLSTITGFVSATNRIRQCSSRKSIRRTDGSYSPCFNSSATR